MCQASCGIASLLILALKDEGIVKQDDAAARIWMFDSKGLLVKVSVYYYYYYYYCY
jgi:hypothetical protein